MKERSAFVSVLIPCFNAAATIDQTIQSALAQEGVAFEVLVIDDGSTDESLEIARSFEPRVRVLTGPNRGASAARNRGIEESAGEWLVFLDSDDLLLPGTLEMRLCAPEASEADAIVCNWQEVVGLDGRTEGGPVKSPDMAALAVDAETACATNWKPAIDALAYRRALVEKVGGFREDLPVVEDARFLFDAACHAAHFTYSPHVGAKVRILPESLSRRDRALFWRCCLLNGTQIEALWRVRASLTPQRMAALADIYNGAAHGLFRAADPSFREALAALRTSRLPIARRNRMAELLSDCAGHRRAVQIAEYWTKSRSAVTGMLRQSPIFRSALPG